MAIGITARPAGYSAAGLTTTSVSTASTAAGSTIDVWVAFNNSATVSSVTDVAGNTYTAFGAGAIDTGSGISVRRYIAVNCNASAINAITVTRSGTSECSFIVAEITGPAASPIDSSAQASGLVTHNGTSNSQSVTTADQAAEIVVSFAFNVIQADADVAPNAGGGSFTQLSDVIDAGGYNLGCAYRIVAATGAQNANWSSIFENSMPIATVGLKEASAGGTVNTATLTDTLVAFDAVVQSIIRGNVSSDTITISDSFFLWWYRTRILESTVVVTEGVVENYTTTNTQALDELTISDEFVAFFRRTRFGEDTIAITDEFIASTIGYLIFVSVLTSQIAVTDEAQSLRYFTRLLESNALTDDQLQRAVFFSRSLLDTLAVSDQSLSAMQRFVLLTDAITLDDSLSGILVSPVTSNPVIVNGFDQPRIELGGYGL